MVALVTVGRRAAAHNGDVVCEQCGGIGVQSCVCPQRLDIGPHQGVPGHLPVGSIVRRYTEPAKRGRLRIEVPCHMDQSVLVMLGKIVTVVCRRCSKSYELTLLYEGDGGYQAVFEVLSTTIVISHWRKTS